MGVRCFNGGVANLESEGHRIPMDFGKDVESWIVRAQREVPAMKLSEFCAGLNNPAIFAVFRSSVEDESQHSADSVIVASRKAKNVRQGGFGPGSIKLRGAQTRGSSSHVPAPMEDAGLLHVDGCASRDRFEVH